jgi:hypothetical protein
MHSLSERDIRASFVNASQRERANLMLPSDFVELDWDSLDYLGWRDRKYDSTAYVVIPADAVGAAPSDAPAFVGVLLRRAEARSRYKSQCAWCDDVQLPNDVVFYGAKRAGKAGRNGDTVGTLVCADFQCSRNVRRRDPAPYAGFDVEAARLDRIAALRDHVAAFAARIME